MSILLPLLIGVATSAIIAYVTASLLLAQKQLIGATRLYAYLLYWQSWTILEGNLFPLFYQGKEWNKEIKEIHRKGGSGKELSELQNRKKEQFFTNVKTQIETGEINLDREQLVADMRRLPKELAGTLLEWSKTTRQNIIDGKTFITDDEAIALGLGMTQKTIALKMGILDLVDGVTGVLLPAIATPEHFEFKDHAAQVAGLVWRGINVSRDIDTLFELVQVFTRRSVLMLTIMNIKSGSRLRIQ